MRESPIHSFSDRELAAALYPWGLVHSVPPRAFDRRRCIEAYVDAMPRRAGTSQHEWKDDRWSREWKPGLLTREEALFWFFAATDPARLAQARGDEAVVAALEELAPSPLDVEVATARLRSWIEACETTYRRPRPYRHAYLAHLLSVLLPLPEVLDVLHDALESKWVVPFLDQVMTPEANAVNAELEEAVRRHTSALAYEDDGHTHSPTTLVTQRNLAERLLPLGRPQDECRRYLDWACRHAAGRPTASMYHVLAAVRDDEEFLTYFDRFRPKWSRREVALLVARFGEAAVGIVVDRVVALRTVTVEDGLVPGLSQLRTPDVVPAFLHLMGKASVANDARRALVSLGEVAIEGLLPLTTHRGRFREPAREVLAELRRDHEQALEEKLETQPEAVQRVMREVTSTPEAEPELAPVSLDTLPAWFQELAPRRKPRGLPKFVTLEALRPLRLRDQEGCLPKEAVWALLEACKELEFDAPEPEVLARIQALVDARSAARFFWSLFEAYDRDGAPARYAWCLAALGVFGDDDVVLELGRVLDVWPAQRRHQRAYDALAVLERIGSDTALMLLSSIAHRSRYKGLKSRAATRLASLAKRLDLTREDLEDRVVDDCGLDEDGTRVFDYGPRAFTLVFDQNLKPVVRDEEGKVRSSLPRPRKTDDEVLVEEARADFKRMKKKVGEVLKVQRRRLENAMVWGRRWPVASWRRLLVEHPLMTHLVQRLLWGVFDADDRVLRTFRVAEDRSLANILDDPYTPPPDGLIGIVHPLEIPPDTRRRWSDVFGDYEIVPPFDQIGRPVYARSDANPHEELTGVDLPPGWLRGHMNNRGWTKERPQGDIIYGFFRNFPLAGIHAQIAIAPGIHAADYRRDSPQQIRSLHFARRGAPLPPNEICPIVYSETLYDLHKIVDRAREDAAQVTT